MPPEQIRIGQFIVDAVAFYGRLLSRPSITPRSEPHDPFFLCGGQVLSLYLLCRGLSTESRTPTRSVSVCVGSFIAIVVFIFVFIIDITTSIMFWPCLVLEITAYYSHTHTHTHHHHPPPHNHRTQSREDLCVWLCQQHNLVNEKLGKPVFRCDISELDDRWKTNKSSKKQCH